MNDAENLDDAATPLQNTEGVNYFPFDYHEVTEGSLIAAVYRKNLAAVTKLLQAGKSVNSNDNRGNTCLHAAAETENLEILEYILQQPGVNIDCQNHTGETPLFLSLQNSTSACALKLVNAGADCALPNHQQVTPLHVAAKNVHHDVALLLLERGVDMNAVDFDLCTALHEAVDSSDLEMVSMLLCFGADANVPNEHGLTPFMVAVHENVDIEIQRLLLDFETDLNRTADDGFSSLFLALNSKSPLVAEMVDRGADVNCFVEDASALELAVYYNDSVVFEKIWERFDYDLQLNRIPICYMMLVESMSTPVWMKCMQMLFFSDKVEEVVFHFIDHDEVNFFSTLTDSFMERDLPESEVYPYICICLSLGIPVYLSNVEAAYDCYGYGDIVKLFMYMNIHVNRTEDLSVPYLMSDIKLQEQYLTQYKFENFNGSNSYEKFFNLLDFCTPSDACKQQFYSASEARKQIMENLLVKYMEHSKIDLKLKSLSVPTLKEISRNASRKAICSHYKINNTGMFYTVLKWLPILDIIKNIISYKVPVNRFDK